MDHAKEQCFLDQDGRFVVEQYNDAKPFTNFFPGIAGVWGTPMWVFYVNRGQCISSFGIESKDKSIMEFQPANKAYRYTAWQGFRTFIKIKKNGTTIFYEPFQDHLASQAFVRSQRMAITTHDLTIEEINKTLGVVVRVNYATLPEEQYAALIRQVTIENISSDKADFEVIDGMPAIVPYGINDRLLKDLSRTVEAWIQVDNLKQKAPFFNLKVIVSDKPYVEDIQEGNFYFSFLNHQMEPKLLEPIVQPACIFSEAKDFCYPKNFIDQENFTIPQDQKTNNKTPCAMGLARFSLASQGQVTITSLIGHVHSKEQLNCIVNKSLCEKYLETKIDRNREIIEEIKNKVFTHSASQALDLYSMHNFVDNVLRGGLPVSIPTEKGTAVFNIYSRKHGDPERDYNYFVLNPTFLSQGNGNFRDVNQNRRNDVWFNRDLKDGGIKTFFNLIQADGYNPLVVQGTEVSVSDERQVHRLINQYVGKKDVEFVTGLLNKRFLAGKFLKEIFENDVKLKISPDHFLMKILAYCETQESVSHGEGFWTDHWTYNLDLVESYLHLYPEETENLLLRKKEFSFYHNAFYVLPREKRYLLTVRGPRQYHSVQRLSDNMLSTKKDHKLRDLNGTGDVYHTTLIVKMLCLLANKVASLDPSGVGVEMEADKPNWYDALNGLPGLVGSSISETIEIKRLAQFLIQSLATIGAQDQRSVVVFEELADFIVKLIKVLKNATDPLAYWQRSNHLKEQYRQEILGGITGKEKNMSLSEIKVFLRLVIARTGSAISLAKNNKGLSTYFYHEIVDFKKLKAVNEQGVPYIMPKEFKRHDLPLFLEGFVHALRVQTQPEQARAFYRKVRSSNLFDKKLKMYQVNADLSKESFEIGRARIFPKGWLENQSIWLHMEYKFLLELLRCGLNEEFCENLENCAVPFLNPATYGRSILENSSFIVSSAHEDPAHHGRGYIARLSGSTAEFLHIWMLMNAGLKPFQLNAQGELELRFSPVLRGTLFTDQEKEVDYFSHGEGWRKISLAKNTYAFNFLGSTLVVYHNPQRMDTFGTLGARIKKIVLTYRATKEKVEICSNVIGSSHAKAVRDHNVERIDIFFE